MFASILYVLYLLVNIKITQRFLLEQNVCNPVGLNWNGPLKSVKYDLSSSVQNTLITGTKIS